jgi:hypothetical protein
MSKLERMSGIAIVVLAALQFLLAGPAQAGHEEPAISGALQKEMMVWMKLAEPGHEHEQLARFVGSWKGEGEFKNMKIKFTRQ